jgi:hypothetical protein
MNTVLITIAAATLGWQTGYRPLPEGGGMEYIIQLDSAAIDSLRAGGTIRSYIPPAIGEIRSFRIIMGTGSVWRELPPAKRSPPKVAETPAPAPPKTVEKPASAPPETPAEPRLPWILLLLSLFASIGANLFLGWITWGLRRRCQIAS